MAAKTAAMKTTGALQPDTLLDRILGYAWKGALFGAMLGAAIGLYKKFKRA